MPETEDHKSEDSNSSAPEMSDTETRQATEADVAPTSKTTQVMRPELGQDDDPLPEWEELSPELMEDECLRGDVMLKWAAILLSVLLGWVYITESSTLVQIRTGEYITTHGFLPPATDVFSATASQRRWVNLNWLSDVVLSLVHRAMGMPGLSVMSAITVGGAFWFLSKISLPNVSTWWASICCLLGVIACFPMIQPGPTAFTILFLAALMWLMFVWQEHPDSAVVWGFPVLMLLWSNTSEEAIFGLLLAVVYLSIQLIIGFGQKQQMSRLGIVLGLTILCGIVFHPFMGGPIKGIEFARLESLEAQAYGGVSEHFFDLMFGMSLKPFWEVLTPFKIAAAGLLAVSFLTLLLNIRRLNWGFTAVWFMANSFALLFGDWAAYAAIVNVSVAILNGQDWYRNWSKMEFKIDSWSVFVARAGRAVTVLSFFALAYVAINGMLMGAEGRRIGTGLDPRWQNRIESTEEVVLHAYSDHIFPLRTEQGDLLIWLGKKPFVDSRLSLYGSGGENLLALHREVRGALFGQGKREEWFDTLKKYEMTDALARLWGRSPAYAPFTQLLVRQDWAMTGIGAAGANFTYIGEPDAALQKHVEAHQAGKFVDQAFRQEDSKLAVSLPPTYPKPTTDYDRWLIQKLPVLSNHVQMARHYDEIRSRLLNFISPQQATALAHLTIRHARADLFEDANEPLTYRLISNAQMQLDEIEQNVTRLSGSNSVLPMRSQLTLHAAFLAAQASGNDPNDLLRLFQIVLSQRKVDVAFDIGSRILTDQRLALVQENSTQLAEMESLLDQLGTHIEQVNEQISKSREEGVEQLQLASMAINSQCPKLAVKLLEEDLTKVVNDPGLQMTFATLLLDVGRSQDGLEQLEGMAAMMQQENIPPQLVPTVSQWRNITALANLIASDYGRATTLWKDEANTLTEATLTSMVHSPFASAMTEPEHLLNPAMNARVIASSLIELPERWSTLQLQQALAELQVGHNASARDLLKGILDEHPEFSLRGNVVYYLVMLTGESYELAPPSSQVPVWGEMFAEDEPVDATSEQEELKKSEAKPQAEMKPQAAPVQKVSPPAPALPEAIQ